MTKQIPTVAVITRTKDRPLFLERAIQSVHGQTWANFIHIIVNDGGNVEAIDSIVKKHAVLIRGRVKVVHNKESLGAQGAANIGIAQSESAYIALHDDDDTWHPKFLEFAVEKLNEGNMGVVLRMDKVIEEVSPDKKEIVIKSTKPWMPDMKVVSLYRQFIDNQLSTLAFVYKRSAGAEIGFYDKTLPVIEDWDFGIRFLLKYDVEYVDPGFAVAFYHHRKYREGVQGNSTFGSNQERHRYYSNKLMNKYLRQEITKGELGVGYIMSQLKYNQGNVARLAKFVLPNFVVNRIKRRIS